MSREIPSGFTDVSVIVAAYQAADTITRTLTSIAAQTLKPVEVVVVDDGSTDATFKTAQAFEPQMNGIQLRVVRMDANQGAGAARNHAIEESTCGTLAFLDADDEWLPEKLERSMAHLMGSNYCLIAHDYWTGDGDAAVHHDCQSRFNEGDDAFAGLYRKGYIPSSSVVAPRERVINAGGFDPDLRNAQDFDLWLAMTRAPGAEFLLFGEPLLRYHMGVGGIMSHTARRLTCCLKIARRYIPDLKERAGLGLPSVLFRTLALYLEAVRAYRRKGRLVQLVLTTLRLPLSLLAMTGFFFLGTPPPRGQYLQKPKGGNE
jgi:teichuronic acid biosynthesis glycosyltransferase TuaG